MRWSFYLLMLFSTFPAYTQHNFYIKSEQNLRRAACVEFSIEENWESNFENYSNGESRELTNFVVLGKNQVLTVLKMLDEYCSGKSEFNPNRFIDEIEVYGNVITSIKDELKNRSELDSDQLFVKTLESIKREFYTILLKQIQQR